ncbi:pancreatic triacylglycerol lipase-like [Xylocopa sonorina]|uniref:pancreatic triacylglycerol lipase-like n=1 Tax=Xylocopa sonorina TaxID=1818115 RepID=UPI00403AA4AD
MDKRGYLYVSLFLVSCLSNNVAFAGDLTANIFIRLFYRNDTWFDVNVRNASQLISKINIKVPTTVFIHGFGEDINGKDVQMITNAYLNNTEENILALDYREVAKQLYTTSVALYRQVGKLLADGLNALIKEGVSPDKLHIIGHSLGAQVAGITGRTTSVPISRITGLDPAGPLFYILNEHLQSGDALFVDIIHTDMGILGLALESGDVDFYPNLGIWPAPGCPNGLDQLLNVCSHERSFIYYAASVKYRNIFIGIKCIDPLHFIENNCAKNQTAAMGYAVPRNARGNYYLQTGANPPYGLGLPGTVFHI